MLLELFVFVLCLLVLTLCSFFFDLCLLCILVCLCFCLLESYSRFCCGIEALLVSLKVSVQCFCLCSCIASFCKRDSFLSGCAGGSLILFCLIFDLCSLYLCAYLCVQGRENLLNLSVRLSFFDLDISGLFCLPGCLLGSVSEFCGGNSSLVILLFGKLELSEALFSQFHVLLKSWEDPCGRVYSICVLILDACL